jgi:hypothetical protein
MFKKSGMVVYAYNPSTQEAEAERSQIWRPLIRLIGLHSEALLSQKEKKKDVQLGTWKLIHHSWEKRLELDTQIL